MDNVELAKRAYSGFEGQAARRASTEDARRGAEDYHSYFDFLADDVVVIYPVPPGTPISGETRGKQAVIDLCTAKAAEDFEDVRLDGPLEFIGAGSRVLILGSESYKIRKTGVTAHNKAFVVVLDFRDGKIVRNLQIKDMSELVDAYHADSLASGGR